MPVSVHGFGKVGAPLCSMLVNAGHTVFVDDPLLPPDREVTLPSLPYERAPYSAEPCGSQLQHVSQAPTDERFEASFVIVPTPSDKYSRFDNSMVLAAIAKAREGRGTEVVIVLSTLDPGKMNEIPTDVVYCPLMIALGDVCRGIISPEYQLVGYPPNSATNTERALRMIYSLQEDCTEYYCAPREEIAWMKLIVNSYLSYKISFFNRLWLSLSSSKACMGDKTIEGMLTRLAGLDGRIGSWGSTPGRIPGGPCLPRDTALLDALCGTGVDRFVRSTNHDVVSAWARRLADRDADAKKLAVAGLTYKRDVPCHDVATGSEVLDSIVGAIGFDQRATDEELREAGFSACLDFTNDSRTPKIRDIQ